MSDAFGFDQPFLDKGAGDANLFLDMIDWDAMQLQMIDHPALGTQCKACAVANERAGKLNVVANFSHDAVEGEALWKSMKPNASSCILLPMRLKEWR